MKKIFFILLALCGFAAVYADEIDALSATQADQTDWFRFWEQNSIFVTINDEGNPVFPDKTYNMSQGNILVTFGTTPEDTWFTVRTDGKKDDWNTICMDRNITAIDGATFWTISGQDANSFVLDEISEPKAGKGYIIRFTKSELKVKYGSETAQTPVDATRDHPIQGIYDQIDAVQTNAELSGNYIVYENKLCLVKTWVGLYAHRAYVKADLVPNGEPQHAPKAARMYMSKSNSTQIDNSSLHHSVNSSFKELRDGQFRIIRDGRTYNAQGIEL